MPPPHRTTAAADHLAAPSAPTGAGGSAPPGGRATRRTRRPAPERLVADLLGHRSLRPGQREAIEAVLAGRDVVSVMATGSGKSAIYQVGGAVLEGSTLVVSPLIALQHDQLSTLHEGGLDEQLGRAAALNSTMTRSGRGGGRVRPAEHPPRRAPLHRRPGTGVIRAVPTGFV